MRGPRVDERRSTTIFCQGSTSELDSLTSPQNRPSWLSLSDPIGDVVAHVIERSHGMKCGRSIARLLEPLCAARMDQVSKIFREHRLSSGGIAHDSQVFRDPNEGVQAPGQERSACTIQIQLRGRSVCLALPNPAAQSGVSGVVAPIRIRAAPAGQRRGPATHTGRVLARRPYPRAGRVAEGARGEGLDKVKELCSWGCAERRVGRGGTQLFVPQFSKCAPPPGRTAPVTVERLTLRILKRQE